MSTQRFQFIYYYIRILPQPYLQRCAERLGFSHQSKGLISASAWLEHSMPRPQFLPFLFLQQVQEQCAIEKRLFLYWWALSYALIGVEERRCNDCVRQAKICKVDEHLHPSAGVEFLFYLFWKDVAVSFGALGVFGCLGSDTVLSTLQGGVLSPFSTSSLLSMLFMVFFISEDRDSSLFSTCSPLITNGVT